MLRQPPLEASSGKTSRHRLNRGGQKQANNALWDHRLGPNEERARTLKYVARRTAEGLSKKEILRCLMFRVRVDSTYRGVCGN